MTQFFQLIRKLNGKETVLCVGTKRDCQKRKELVNKSHRGQKVTFTIEPTDKTEKFVHHNKERERDFDRPQRV
jgi:hypothetical protein